MEFHYESIKKQFKEFCKHHEKDLAKKQNQRLTGILFMMEKFEFSTNRRLIVLDLNGVLVETVFSPNLEEKRDGWYRVGKSLRRLMPETKMFLDYLFHNDFRVAIWSSSYLNNVTKTIDGLLPEYKDRFVFVWGQEMCEKENDGDAKPIFWKNVTKILEEYPQYDSQYDPINVFIMDDTHQKLEKNPPCNNLIFKEGINPVDQLLSSHIYSFA